MSQTKKRARDTTGIEAEVFDEFFSKLETERSVLIAKLKKLRENNELDSLEKILNAFEEEEQNGVWIFDLYLVCSFNSEGWDTHSTLLVKGR